jgi:mRNA interferase YafQ
MDMAKLADVVRILADGEMLPREYFDHMLHGKYEGYRECHIEPDWLLIYKITESVLVLSLVRTGSHSRLFMR